MGDQFNMSGDFRGAILNIQSTLTHVQQTVNEIPTDHLDARQVLPPVVTIAAQIVATAMKLGG